MRIIVWWLEEVVGAFGVGVLLGERLVNHNDFHLCLCPVVRKCLVKWRN